MTVIEALGYLVYLLVLLSIIAVLFLERRDPATTLIWVLILSYLPGIGLVLYWFLGRGLKIITLRKLRIRQAIRERYWMLPPGIQQLVENTRAIAEGEEFVFSDPVAKRYIQLMHMNLQLSDSLYSQDNRVEVFCSAQEKYEALFEDIRNAKETINLIYFIISNNNAGHQLLSLLAQKAREGVEVNLIYDELGSITTPHRMFSGLRKAGGNVYRFFPLKLGTLLHANYRNHHKIVVIDGRIAYTGGMNIGDEYLGLHPRKTPWRDTHMRIRGSAVLSLQFLFLLDLFYATEDEDLLRGYLTSRYFPKQEAAGTTGIQVVHSGPDSGEAAIKRSIIHMIGRARRSVMIQSPYLMPDDAVLHALQNAAASGVDVQVMLPGVPDKRAVYYVTVSYIQPLLDYGIKVYLYQGFLHAKMIVVDDTLCSLGTCNMDMRSFHLHFEVNCHLYDSGLARHCLDIFQRDKSCSTPVTQEAYAARGRLRIFWERLLRLFAPLM